MSKGTRKRRRNMKNLNELMGWATKAADETDELLADELEDQHQNEKSGYIYPCRETAWLGYYEVAQLGLASWQAVCIMHKDGNGCGVVVNSYTKGTVMDAIEWHIMHDGKESINKGKLTFPIDPPF